MYSCGVHRVYRFCPEHTFKEDFSSSSTPTDFADKSDGDDRCLKLGCSFLLELIAELGSADGEGGTQLHPRDGADAYQW